MTTDHEALLAAVLRHPKEDAPRLIYADALDELGGPENAARAAYIRRAIERHNLAWSVRDPECTSSSAGWCPWCGDCTCARPEESRSDPGCPLHDPVSDHGDRREKLIYADSALVVLMTPEREDAWVAPLLEIGWQANSTWVPECEWRWERGFVTEITLSTSNFLAWAYRIFARHPVERVRLPDRAPWSMDDNAMRGPPTTDGIGATDHMWYRSTGTVPPHPFRDSEDIPAEIFDAMPGALRPGFGVRASAWKQYASEADAYAALSTGCVRLGRSRAGLVPPEETIRVL